MQRKVHVLIKSSHLNAGHTIRVFKILKLVHLPEVTIQLQFLIKGWSH